MPTKILLKRSDIPSLVPHLDELEFGEIALNVFDGSLYAKISQAGTETIQKLNGGYDNIIISDPDTDIGEERIPRMVKMTQADYDAIVPDDNTLYVIVG